MKIIIPDNIPATSADVLEESKASLEDWKHHAREMEIRYTKLKMFHDNCLEEGFAPFLPSVPISDEDLERMLFEAGWTVDKRGFTAEEWRMWTNRFRRLFAIKEAAERQST